VTGRKLVLPGLAASVLFFNLLDNLTTYICLREPVPGYQVTEVNPLADWLFQAVGLVPGLVFDFALTLVVVVFVATSSVKSLGVRLIILGALSLLSAYASVNNLIVMFQIGLLGV
jgi:hypothetical protein